MSTDCSFQMTHKKKLENITRRDRIIFLVNMRINGSLWSFQNVTNTFVHLLLSGCWRDGCPKVVAAEDDTALWQIFSFIC